MLPIRDEHFYVLVPHYAVFSFVIIKVFNDTKNCIMEFWKIAALQVGLHYESPMQKLWHIVVGDLIRRFKIMWKPCDITG